MSKEFSKKFYNSKEWKDCRQSFISYRVCMDGGMCERCHAELGKIVHHKQHINMNNINDPNITMSFRNLKYLCAECHMLEHGFHKEKENKRYIINADGSIRKNNA